MQVKAGLEVSVGEFTSLPSFNIKSKFDKDVIETLFIQEMLKRLFSIYNYLSKPVSHKRNY